MSALSLGCWALRCADGEEAEAQDAAREGQGEEAEGLQVLTIKFWTWGTSVCPRLQLRSLHDTVLDALMDSIHPLNLQSSCLQYVLYCKQVAV